MKNYLALIFSLVIFSSLVQAQTGYISLKGKKFLDGNGNAFYPKVLNYGINIVWDSINNIHYIAPHHGTSYNSVNYSCTTGSNPSCHDEVLNDLTYIKNTMGFNTIRLVGATVAVDGTYTNCSGGNLGGVSVFNIFNTIPNAAWNGNLSQTAKQYNRSGITQTILFNLISEVLSIANSLNLKVILLAGGGNVCQEQSRGDLRNYFSALASNFATNPALMAYDLYNEPGTSDGSFFNKKDLCIMVEGWYDAIKANDPNHLVTIGFTDAGTIMEWDPGALKLDFPSLHYYPFIPPATHTTAEITNGFNRVLSQIYWTSNNINAPWIVGETGFLGSDDSWDNWYSNAKEGTETDQKNFVQQTMDKTRDCGGTGYSYWWFQDVGDNRGQSNPEERKGDLTGLVYRNGNHTVANYVLQDSYYGQFASYNVIPQSPCSVPPNYLVPHPEFINNPVTNGYIKDENSVPIKDAVVFGWDQNWGNLTQTFTDANGFFNLFSPSPTNPIKIVRAAAVGSNEITNTTFASGGTIKLRLSEQHKNISLSSTIISYPTVLTEETYNNITAGDYIVSGNGSNGGDVTFKAGGEIDLKDGFEVKRGAAFHAMYGIPVPNCVDGAYWYAPAIEDPANSSKMVSHLDNLYNLQTVNMNRDFLKSSSSSVSISIYPNPSANGKAEIFISDAEPWSGVIVTDMFGRTIQQSLVQSSNFKIDISGNPKGIYFVKMVGEKNTVVKKIILQ